MGFIQERDQNSHKGENGKVLVIGGSESFIGAVAFAGMACFRTGVDITVIAAPSKVAWSINSIYPEIITRKLQGDFINYDNLREVVEMAEKFDCVLIGNGIGLEESTKDFVREFVKVVSVPKVIDADALKALNIHEIDNAIITPHQTEFEIITGEELPFDINQRAQLVSSFAREKLVVLLKGNIDIISDGNNVKFNKTGNPAMTKGGTGDVLAGLCAGFLALTKDMFNSAYYAAYLNGKMGDYLLKEKGTGFSIQEMIDSISIVMKKEKI